MALSDETIRNVYSVSPKIVNILSVKTEKSRQKVFYPGTTNLTTKSMVAMLTRQDFSVNMKLKPKLRICVYYA